ncbi:hypothetical protein Tco_0181601, partial [Tanacetum coccineum]
YSIFRCILRFEGVTDWYQSKGYRELDSVMSDSEGSAVTYTSVYTDSEPGRVFWGTDEEPMYPEYVPLEDDHILLAEEQPLPPVGSPTAESPGYVAESDPEEDPEYEDDKEQDGPVDYPMDEEEEEEEKQIASADSTTVIPIVELVSSPEGTEPII